MSVHPSRANSSRMVCRPRPSSATVVNRIVRDDRELEQRIVGRRVLAIERNGAPKRVLALANVHTLALVAARQVESLGEHVARVDRTELPGIAAGTTASTDVRSIAVAFPRVIAPPRIVEVEHGHSPLGSALCVVNSGQVSTTEVFPGISMDPDVRFGKPCLTGTRIDVATIVGAVAAGETVETVAEEYALAIEQVRSALSYAAHIAAHLPPAVRQAS
jgi:uncharacterized protein (DUF433 family)